MKRIFSLLLIFALAISLAACGGNTNTTSTTPADGDAAAEKKIIRIVIANRGDLSYWDGIAEGGDRAAADFADRADIKVIESGTDLQANLTALYEAADEGADLLISGVDFMDNLLEVAAEYPEMDTVMLNEYAFPEYKNMYCFDFRSSEAAFLAGIAAADVASQGIEGTSGQKTIGFIGGMDEIATIQEFLVGYIQGAKYYDAETKVLCSYVGDWADPDTGRTQALAQFNDAGADVIFACAGGSGNGVHTAAADTGKYTIGVDTDQSQMYVNDAQIQSRFVTSVLKLTGNGIYTTVENYLNGEELAYGDIELLGLNTGAVDIVENDLYTSLVSEQGREMIAQARQDIIDGKLEVKSVFGMEQSDIQKMITDMIG